MIRLLCVLLIFHGLSIVLGSMIMIQFENKITPGTIRRLLKADVIGAPVLVGISLIAVEILGAVNMICGCVSIKWFVWVDYLIIAAGAVVILLKRRRSNEPERSKDNGQSKDSVRSKGTVAVIAMVLLQIVYVTVLANKSAVALRPIRYATGYYESGVIDLAKPMMILVGEMARRIGMHPTGIAFILSPILLIPIYYGLYSLLLGEICESRIQKEIALVIICALHIWGYQSDALMPANMMVTPYGGWVFLIDGLLPLIAYALICKKKAFDEIQSKVLDEVQSEALDERQKSAADVTSEDELTNVDNYCEEWDMKKHPIINARNLAIALGVIAAALVVLVYMLNNKINRLYDATVNLETDLNSRCSIYEFCPQEGADPTGFLIKDSQGRLTMIGGGGIDDTDEIYDFIIQYGNVIDTWYVYGSEDADRGAYDGCVIYKDLEIKNVYAIEREEAPYNADSN